MLLNALVFEKYSTNRQERLGLFLQTSDVLYFCAKILIFVVGMQNLVLPVRKKVGWL